MYKSNAAFARVEEPAAEVPPTFVPERGVVTRIVTSVRAIRAGKTVSMEEAVKAVGAATARPRVKKRARA